MAGWKVMYLSWAHGRGQDDLSSVDGAGEPAGEALGMAPNVAIGPRPPIRLRARRGRRGIFLNPKGPRRATHPLNPHPSMLNLIPPGLLSEFHPGEFVPFAGMLIPIVILALVFGLIATTLYFRSKERERWHETVRLALEKGHPIPNMNEELSAQALSARLAPESRHRQRMKLVTGGLVNIAVGIGLYYGLSEMPEVHFARFFALIPGLIGVALLMSALIDAVFSDKHSDSGNDTPRS
jgi:Domain of unknown function (DUF6249)